MSVLGMKNERTSVFIDGANLYGATKSLGYELDFKKLRNFFDENTNLVRCNYYTAMLEDDEGVDKLRPLVDFLDYNGYNCVTKPAKEFTDVLGRKKIKGNLDCEIIVDMIEASTHSEQIVLFSGDGDFKSAVALLQRRGCKVTVVSTLKVQITADELRRQCDNFIELDDLAKIVGRETKVPKTYSEPAPFERVTLRRA